MRIILDFALGAVLAAVAQDGPERDVHHLLGILDYLSADYAGAVDRGRVVSAPEYEEQRAFAEEALSVARSLAGDGHPAYVEAAERVKERVDAKADAADVRAEASSVRREVLATFDVRCVPDARPSFERGRELYGKTCAVCHAETGDAKTPRAETLEPPPLSFLGKKGREALSPYRAFNVSTFGVAGTAMASFDTLPARERWDLAFYVTTLRWAAHDAAEARPAGLPAWSLGDLAGASDAELDARLAALGRDATTREADLAWLRRRAPYEGPAPELRLGGARALVNRAADVYREGRPEEAGRLASEAYLSHVEPAEAALAAISRAALADVESGFLRLRGEIRRGGPPAGIARAAESLDRDLARAASLLETGSRTSGFAFGAAALIVLREGFEAVLLLAAMVACIRKAGRPEAARLVHLGWIAALAASVATWWASSRVIAIAPAERELVEGVIGLVAAGVLAYTSYWILSRMQARKWMDLARRRIEQSTGRGQRFALFGLAFLAVYREGFETVLFLQGVLIEAGPASRVSAGLGFLAGLACLGLVVLAFAKLARRLPIRPFFLVSGGLLYLLAFVFAGSGMHALVTGGYLEPRPVRFVTIEWLGIHPDLTGLSLQLAFVIAVAVGIAIEARAAKPAPASS
ncbi:MAG TPA: cytochrome c/FTR1 family iron permease [Planctomycetota bacterium]|nr:cytochrome c/FTR1 family iron permease [Planctomycetota bacterium]